MPISLSVVANVSPQRTPIRRREWEIDTVCVCQNHELIKRNLSPLGTL
jgi:hypothetical protein